MADNATDTGPQPALEKGHGSEAMQAAHRISVSNILAKSPPEGMVVLYQPDESIAPKKLLDKASEKDALKTLIQQHLERMGITNKEASEQAFSSVNDVIESHIRAQHKDQASKQFDFSSLFDSLAALESGQNLSLTLTFSQHSAGKLMAVPVEGVHIAYDGHMGVATISGSRENVQAFLAQVYFYANVKELGHFSIDVHITTTPQEDEESDITLIDAAQAEETTMHIELLSAKIVLFYEKQSGFYVATQPVTSSGTSQTTSLNALITTPVGAIEHIELQKLPDHFQQTFTSILQPDTAENDVPLQAKAPTPMTPPVVEDDDTNHTPEPDPPAITIEELFPHLTAVSGNGFNDIAAILPNAVADSYNSTINATLVIDATNGLTGLLDNDQSNLLNPTLTIQNIDTNSANGGTIVDNMDGTYSYTPATLFIGTDSFSYIVTNGEGSTSATVNITVAGNAALTASVTDILASSTINATFTGIAADWHDSDSIYGGSGDDSLTITAGTVNLTIDAGNYTNIEEVEQFIFQADAAHSLTLDSNYFTRGTGLDNDRLTIDMSVSATNGVTVEAGTTGASYSYDITSSNGDDSVNAGSGDDSITAGTGADTINAGAGDDTITLDWSPAAPNAFISGNLVFQLDAAVTGSITGHPGNVTSWADQSGNGRNATDNADEAAFVSSGGTMNGNNSLQFSGNATLEIAGDASINTTNPTQTRSIYMSFETGADITTKQFLYEQGGSTNGFSLYISGGNLVAGAWKSNGSAFDIFLTTPITTNTAYTAGWVFDSITDHFTAYLGGTSYSSVAPGQDQSNHSGEIGIGGVNDNTRDDTGTITTSYYFTGQIGEILYYDDALSGAEVASSHEYLSNKWITPTVSDSIAGGTGTDTLIQSGSALTYDGLTDIGFSGIEYLDLTNEDAAHDIRLADATFTAGTGITGNQMTIDATGNNTGITLDLSNLSATYSTLFLQSDGNDTITGGSGTDILSYENASSAITLNLGTGTATGAGTDSINNILIVTGSDFGDSFTGGTGQDSLSGSGGNDTLDGGTTSAGAFVSGNLVFHLDASQTGSVTTHPGNVTL